MQRGIWNIEGTFDISSYHAIVKLEVPFENMCDASDYAIGAILGQRVGKASHATTMPLELLMMHN